MLNMMCQKTLLSNITTEANEQMSKMSKDVRGILYA